MTAPKKSPASATINRPLHIPFGTGYNVPPLKAISALRVNAMFAAAVQDDLSDEDIEQIMSRLRDLGVEDPENLGEFEIGNELFGLDINVAMLNDLSKPEYDVARAAVLRWITPMDGETAQDARKAAEELLANPTGAARPQDRKAPAKKTPARKPAQRTSSSK